MKKFRFEVCCWTKEVGNYNLWKTFKILSTMGMDFIFGKRWVTFVVVVG